MKKLLTLAMIAAMCPAIYAADAAAPEAAPEPVAAPAPQTETTLDKIVANMPKISGYLQTG